MTTIIIDYPQDMVFRTKKTFTNDEERTRYIRQRLSKVKYNSFHHHTDFVVELVEPLKNNHEFWGIGS